eukprot:gb/GECG01008309.1/.p1 GENE.gb/GECG01008309.1/~~gb/GECG01008309.1/.p1  ORF type:complete len:834 (+),score=93.86 gb/GECG01008309.1/:1-2502(+)
MAPVARHRIKVRTRICLRSALIRVNSATFRYLFGRDCFSYTDIILGFLLLLLLLLYSAKMLTIRRQWRLVDHVRRRSRVWSSQRALSSPAHRYPTLEEIQPQTSSSPSGGGASIQGQEVYTSSHGDTQGKGGSSTGAGGGGEESESKTSRFRRYVLRFYLMGLAAFVSIGKVKEIQQHEQYNEMYSFCGFGKRFFYGNKEQQAIVDQNRGPDYVVKEGQNTPVPVKQKAQTEEIVPSSAVSAAHLSVPTPLKNARVRKLKSGITIINGEFEFDHHRIEVCDMRPRSYGKTVSSGSDGKETKPVIVLNFGTADRAARLQRKLVEDAGCRVIAYSHGGLSCPDNPELRSVLSVLHNGGKPPGTQKINSFSNFGGQENQKNNTLDAAVKEYYSVVIEAVFSEFRAPGWYCHSRKYWQDKKRRSSKIADETLKKAVLRENMIPTEWNLFRYRSHKDDGSKDERNTRPPTIGRMPTSDYHSRELAALLEYLNIEEDTMLISENFNWLSTLKTARNNLQFMAGVILLDPWIPEHFASTRSDQKNSKTSSAKFDHPRNELRWLTPEKSYGKGGQLTASDLLLESLYRDIVFQVGPSKRLFVSEVAKKVNVSPLVGEVWNDISKSDPRVEYLYQQICCLGIEDYVVKANLAKQRKSNEDSLEHVQSKLGVPQNLAQWNYQELHKAPNSVDTIASSWTFREHQSSQADWLKTADHMSGIKYLLKSSYSAEQFRNVPVSVLITRQNEKQLQFPEMAYSPMGPGLLSTITVHYSSDPSPQELAYRKALLSRSDALAKGWSSLYPNGVYFVHRSNSLFDAPWTPEYSEVTKHVRQLIEYRSRNKK